VDQNRFDAALAQEISKYYDDPVGFVMFCYPWGEKGTPLEPWPEGPDEWQLRFLTRWGEEICARKFDGVTAVKPVQISVASGHGIGKQISCHVPFKKPIIDPLDSRRAIGMQDIQWGELKVGDYVFGSDGRPTRVIATRKFVRPSYKVTFDDGSSTVVGAEHEWNVRGRQERRKN
jgi:hypothetical protein